MFLSILYMVAFLSEAARRGSFHTRVSFRRWAPLLGFPTASSGYELLSRSHPSLRFPGVFCCHVLFPATLSRAWYSLYRWRDLPLPYEHPAAFHYVYYKGERHTLQDALYAHRARLFGWASGAIANLSVGTMPLCPVHTSQRGFSVCIRYPHGKVPKGNPTGPPRLPCAPAPIPVVILVPGFGRTRINAATARMGGVEDVADRQCF